MILKNNKDLKIVYATKEDAKQIIEYLNEVAGETDNLSFGLNEFSMTVEQEELFIEQVNASINSKFLLGKIEDEIVSVASIMGSPRSRLSHNVDLGISVRKKYWGLKIGSTMMESILEFAKSNTVISNIQLRVLVSNKAAVHLYEKYGFEKVGINKRYFCIDGMYHDLLNMELHIDK